MASLEKTSSRFFWLLRFAGMSRCWGRGDGARNKVEDGPQAVKDIMLAGKLAGIVEGQIGACVLEQTGQVSIRRMHQGGLVGTAEI